MTKLNAAPVKKQPSQVTVRLRFQFMGTSEGDIAFHSMMRVLRYHQFNYERTNYNYAPTLPASQCGELLKLKEGKNCSLTAAILSIARRYAFRASFKAAMQPHILLWRHHNALLNNLIHPCGSRFCALQRRRIFCRKNDQFVAFPIGFTARNEGDNTGFRHAREHPGTGGRSGLVDGE